MFDWTVTAEPEEEPVTVAECKAWAHIDTDADDTVIGQMITAARIWAEEFTGRSFVTQTITAKSDYFQDSMQMPQSPLASVTSITYLDQDGATQTLDSSYYNVDTTSEPGLVTLAYDYSWPSIQTVHHAVTITHVSGYGEASDVPSKFKVALMMLVANMDCHREATSPVKAHEVPFGVREMLSINRVQY